MFIIIVKSKYVNLSIFQREYCPSNLNSLLNILAYSITIVLINEYDFLIVIYGRYQFCFSKINLDSEKEKKVDMFKWMLPWSHVYDKIEINKITGVIIMVMCKILFMQQIRWSQIGRVILNCFSKISIQGSNVHVKRRLDTQVISCG